MLGILNEKADVICYACGRGEAPENTLEAIAHCQKVNPDWRIEMDLQLTQDGEVVLFHDADLKRIANVSRSIAELTYDELCRLISGRFFSVKNGLQLDSREFKVPLLSDVFGSFPQAKFLLDIHSTNLKLVEVVIRLVERFYMEEQIVIVSKHHHILTLFRKKRPGWKYGASAREVKLILIAHFLGLTRLIKPRVDVIMMPVIYKNRKVVGIRLMNLFKRQSVKTWLWLHEGNQVVTVDSRDQFERVKEYGADAFFTSCPERVYQELYSIK